MELDLKGVVFHHKHNMAIFVSTIPQRYDIVLYKEEQLKNSNELIVFILMPSSNIPFREYGKY